MSKSISKTSHNADFTNIDTPEYRFQRPLQPIKGFNMVGHGDITRSTCGTYKMDEIVGCLNHYQTKYRRLRINCKRQTCPECWNFWRHNQTEKAYQRLLWFNEKIVPHMKIIHGELGPADDFETIIDEDSYRKQYNKAKQLITKIGVIAALIVRHPWRYTESTKQWREGFHWHFVGFLNTKNMMKSDDFHDKYNWQYRIIPRDSGSIFIDIFNPNGYVELPQRNLKNTHKELWNIISYELGHAGYTTTSKTHTVNWFGKLSNYYLSTTKHRDIEYEHCSECDSKYHYFKQYIDAATRKPTWSIDDNDIVLFNRKPLSDGIFKIYFPRYDFSIRCERLKFRKVFNREHFFPSKIKKKRPPDIFLQIDLEIET